MDHEILHRQNYMQAYVPEKLEHYDLFKGFIKDNDNQVEEYNKLYVDIIQTLNENLKKNIEYTLFLVKIEEKKYIIENNYLYTKLNAPNEKYKYLNDNELLFTEIHENDINTNIPLDLILNGYKIKKTEYDLINDKLRNQHLKYYMRSGMNDLLKNFDISEGFQNNRSQLSLILVCLICLLFYLVLKE